MRFSAFLSLILICGCASSIPDREEEYEESREHVQNWEWPMKNINVISPFGKRSGRFHMGLDLKAKKGTQVYAVDEGTVIRAGTNGGGYGKIIVIEHEDNLTSFYAHLSQIGVKEGDYVEKGAPIGLSGQTGRASTPHLHFEVRRGKVALDPLHLYPNRGIAASH